MPRLGKERRMKNIYIYLLLFTLSALGQFDIAPNRGAKTVNITQVVSIARDTTNLQSFSPTTDSLVYLTQVNTGNVYKGGGQFKFTAIASRPVNGVTSFASADAGFTLTRTEFLDYNRVNANWAPLSKVISYANTNNLDVIFTDSVAADANATLNTTPIFMGGGKLNPLTRTINFSKYPIASPTKQIFDTSATGIVKVTVEDRVPINWYGGIADYQSADTSSASGADNGAIINNISAKGVVRLKLPGGEYYSSSQVTIAEGMSIAAQTENMQYGASWYFDGAPTEDAFSTIVENIDRPTFQGFQIRDVRTTGVKKAGTGIYLSGTINGASVKHMLINQFPEAGIQIGNITGDGYSGTSDNYEIEDVWISTPPDSTIVGTDTTLGKAGIWAGVLYNINTIKNIRGSSTGETPLIHGSIGTRGVLHIEGAYIEGDSSNAVPIVGDFGDSYVFISSVNENLPSGQGGSPGRGVVGIGRNNIGIMATQTTQGGGAANPAKFKMTAQNGGDLTAAKIAIGSSPTRGGLRIGGSDIFSGGTPSTGAPTDTLNKTSIFLDWAGSDNNSNTYIKVNSTTYSEIDEPYYGEMKAHQITRTITGSGAGYAVVDGLSAGDLSGFTMSGDSALIATGIYTNQFLVAGFVSAAVASGANIRMFLDNTEDAGEDTDHNVQGWSVGTGNYVPLSLFGIRTIDQNDTLMLKINNTTSATDVVVYSVTLTITELR